MPYIIAALIVVVLGVGFTLFKTNSPAESAPVVTESTTTAPVAMENEVHSPGSAATQSAYKDGTYTSEVTYLTPIRKEYRLDVELTVKDGIVTASNVDYSQGAEIDPNPKNFEAAYKTEVIGKSLDSINLSRVGGASLTTAAFNKALLEIKADATS